MLLSFLSQQFVSLVTTLWLCFLILGYHLEKANSPQVLNSHAVACVPDKLLIPEESTIALTASGWAC